jgi:hypothetical protein
MFRGASCLSLLGFLVSCRSSSTPSPDAAPLPPDASPDLTQVDLAATQVDFGVTQVDLGGTQVDLGSPEIGAPVACAAGPEGSLWAGWRLPDPAVRTFDVSAGDVVSDPGTGLMWQRKVAPEQLGWEDAKKYCSCLGLAGYDDWHLPTRIELVTLVDYRRQDPSIDVEAFPDTPVTWFWSSSPVADDPLVSWYLSFMDGNTHEAARDVTYGVRCVRGKVATRPQYQISGGTVLDPATNLTWQRGLDGTVRTWEQARDYCSGLALAGGGWRLPTMSELQSLIDETVKEPAIDRAAFPNTPSEGFWASTPLAGMPPYYWFVSFDRGIAYNAVPTHLYNTRCVR